MSFFKKEPVEYVVNMADGSQLRTYAINAGDACQRIENQTGRVPTGATVMPKPMSDFDSLNNRTFWGQW